MVVKFLNSYGKLREIGTGADMQECYAIIMKFLDEYNYKSYYQRTWKENDYWVVDVGSHSEFFYIYE